jgi:hypothetical protein
MKKAILRRIVICLVLAQITGFANAQQTKPWSVRRAYINFSASLNDGSTAQFNVHFNNRWVGFVGYDGGHPKSKNLPKNYVPGRGSFLGIEWENAVPTDEYTVVTLGVGRVLTPPSDKAWIIGTCAISAGRYNELQFSPQRMDSYYIWIAGGTSSNYRDTASFKTMVGIAPGIEAHANLSRFMAISAGAKMHISTAGIFPRFQLGFDFGLMRPSRKNMIRKDGSVVPAH